MRSNQQNLGFTAIELMVVIAIMLLLTTLTVTGVTRSLRASSLHNAGAVVQAAASAAQQEAINMAKVGSGAHYTGVLIGYQNNRWAVAPVRITSASATPTFSDALLDEEGRPSVSSLSPNIVMWEGDDPMSTSDTVFWAYEPSTGRTMVPVPSGLSNPGALLGYSPPPLTNGADVLVFGALSGAASVEIAFPPTADNPGFSMRSRDQREKRKVLVQSSGLLQIQEFE